MLVSTQTENDQSLTKKTFFGIESTPELIGILLAYFVQGILGLSNLAVSFFLKDDLGLGPAEVAALTGIAALPWVIKPVFGFMSDGLPILGYRRRPYLVLSGLLGSVAWVAMATVVNSPLATILAMTLSAFSIAVSDVIVDSLVVERSRGESLADAGTLQSICWGSSAIGGLLVAAFSSYLLAHFSNRTIFAIIATFPLILSGVAWLISEQRIHLNLDISTVRHQVQELRKAISQKSIWLPIIFLFLWLSTPNTGSSLLYFTTNELGFEPAFIGKISLVTSIAGLIGVWLFQRFFKTVPFRKIFGWTAILTTLLGMSVLLLVTHANRALGIDDRLFSVADSLVITVMGKIAYMPLLVLAARICPAGMEATLFALLMSVMNFSALISNELGALFTSWLGITESNFNNLWILVLIANLSKLLPLPFLGLLPGQESETGFEKPTLANASMMAVDSTISQKVEQPLLTNVASE